MKNNNTMLKKEIKDEVVLVLERRIDEKLDIMNEKQKDLDDKMSTMTQYLNTIIWNLSTMTHNHNTLMEVLQKLMHSTMLRTRVNPPLYFVGIFFRTHMLCKSSH